jgi:hypothetical protein
MIQSISYRSLYQYSALLHTPSVSRKPNLSPTEGFDRAEGRVSVLFLARERLIPEPRLKE